MKLCRYRLRNKPDDTPDWGTVAGDSVVPLSPQAPPLLRGILSQSGASLARSVGDSSSRASERLPLTDVQLLPPLDHQEVWAAGVTYQRSRVARMEESDFSASAYDLVYEADRPELFFKANAQAVSGPGDPVGIRADSHWSVPEPELALVMSPTGKVVAVTIGNDMSARDIEGENLLYLPQAKIYRHACALGPWLVTGCSESEIRGWVIRVEIRRGDDVAFRGETSLGRLRRSFEELAAWLYRSRELPHGAVLLTGTGIVPPDEFTLQAGDLVTIAVDGIGELTNPVTVV